MEPQKQGWKLSHSQGQHPREVGDIWDILGLFPEGTLNTTKEHQCVWKGCWGGGCLRSIVLGAGDTGTLSCYKGR